MPSFKANGLGRRGNRWRVGAVAVVAAALLAGWGVVGLANGFAGEPAASPVAVESSSAQTVGAPTVTFPVGRRGDFAFKRGSRKLTTRIWYPSLTGTVGAVSPDAPIAVGTFPLVVFSHGLGGMPENYLQHIVPLAAAGFLIAAPVYPNTSTGGAGKIQEALDGTQSLDATQVITSVLALNDVAGGPFFQKIDTTRGVGAAGHSAGGITTHGLISAKRDPRITAAVIYAGQSIGAPTGASVNVLFEHGDQDRTVPYANGRAAYEAITWPKAFLTHVGQGHLSWVWPNGVTNPQAVDALRDWMRWSLYADDAARLRLPSDAANGSLTRWESTVG